MSFDPTPITSQSIAIEEDSVLVSWASTAPAGSIYQVYLDRVLSWHGTALATVLPFPGDRATYAIGVVDPADATTDYSGSLPADPMCRAQVAWSGGSYQSATIDHFLVYASPGPGLAVSYAAPVATVPAYDGGVATDGYGMGGYGSGGYGQAASSYSWTSPRLASGSWSYAVIAVDRAGNQSTVQTQSVTISAPPRPPAPLPNQSRLAYTYNQTSMIATLTWNGSPT